MTVDARQRCKVFGTELGLWVSRCCRCPRPKTLCHLFKPTYQSGSCCFWVAGSIRVFWSTWTILRVNVQIEASSIGKQRPFFERFSVQPSAGLWFCYYEQRMQEYFDVMCVLWLQSQDVFNLWSGDSCHFHQGTLVDNLCLFAFECMFFLR